MLQEHSVKVVQKTGVGGEELLHLGESQVDGRSVEDGSEGDANCARQPLSIPWGRHWVRLICMRKPSNENGFSHSRIRPPYPIISATQPQNIANAKTHVRHFIPCATCIIRLRPYRAINTLLAEREGRYWNTLLEAGHTANVQLASGPYTV